MHTPSFNLASLSLPPPGKPAKIVDKMIAGRMSKFYQEVCLLEQPFVMDDSKKVCGAGEFENVGFSVSLTYVGGGDQSVQDLS